jgi:hypothetical protein
MLNQTFYCFTGNVISKGRTGNRSHITAFLVTLMTLPILASTPTCSGTACSTNQDGPVWSGVMLSDGTTPGRLFQIC